jgi:hypothetical protein
MIIAMQIESSIKDLQHCCCLLLLLLLLFLLLLLLFDGNDWTEANSLQTNGFPKAVKAMTLTKYRVFSIGQSLWGDYPENRTPAQLPSPRL